MINSISFPWLKLPKSFNKSSYSLRMSARKANISYTTRGTTPSTSTSWSCTGRRVKISIYKSLTSRRRRVRFWASITSSITRSYRAPAASIRMKTTMPLNVCHRPPRTLHRCSQHPSFKRSAWRALFSLPRKKVLLKRVSRVDSTTMRSSKLMSVI